MANKIQSYTIRVIGEAEAPVRGAVPHSIDDLIKKPSKDVASLIFSAAKAQVELCVQSGDIAAAWEAIEKYQKQSFEYVAPLNEFKHDKQNGHAPYMGAHCYFGAFRDAADFLFDDIFYKGSADKGKKPSKKHLRKAVCVRPNHIFFYRPDLNGAMITKADEVEGQQPSPEVKGFARYETIYPPFQFQFFVNINPRGPFEKFLSDRDKVVETIYQAANHGHGATRSGGYGLWQVVDIKIEDGLSLKA